MGSVAEIVLILIIIVIVFGVGKVTRIGPQLSKARKELKAGLDGADKPEEVIDITPESEDNVESYDPKPGTRVDPIEEAEIEAPQPATDPA